MLNENILEKQKIRERENVCRHCTSAARGENIRKEKYAMINTIVYDLTNLIV